MRLISPGRCGSGMLNKVLFSIGLACLGTSPLFGNTVRAPLVAYIGPSAESKTSWFTETRVWNLGAQTASVTVTDIIGWGPTRPLTFSVPAGGLRDVPYTEFASGVGDFLALVEFSSDQPIRVETSVNTYMVVDPVGCPGANLGFRNVYYGDAGCVPIAGPLLHGFEQYFQPGVRAVLDWLTLDGGAFRTTLYLTNPSASAVTVSATFTNAAGNGHVTRSFSIAPHSLLTLPQLFRDPAFLDFMTNGGFVEQAPGQITAALTAVFTANGPFYVFAAAVANDVVNQPSVINRFTVVQGQPVP